MNITKYTEENNKNYKLFSNIPETCNTEPCVLGIDEAGRGPVLGPMVYGISFCPVSRNQDLKELGVDDSKQLTEEQREKLLEKVLDNNDYIGWAVHLLSPNYISTSMNKRGKYNLNAMSHDTAIGLVKDAQVSSDWSINHILNSDWPINQILNSDWSIYQILNSDWSGAWCQCC